jgi:hypothetical protein
VSYSNDEYLDRTDQSTRLDQMFTHSSTITDDNKRCLSYRTRKDHYVMHKCVCLILIDNLRGKHNDRSPMYWCNNDHKPIVHDTHQCLGRCLCSRSFDSLLDRRNVCWKSHDNIDSCPHTYCLLNKAVRSMTMKPCLSIEQNREVVIGDPKKSLTFGIDFFLFFVEKKRIAFAFNWTFDILRQTFVR